MPRETSFPVEHHKHIVRRLFEDVWSKGDFEQVSRYIAPQMAFHFRGKTSMLSPDDLILIVQRWRAAFPDLQYEIGALVAEQDMVAVRLTRQGTHQGVWKGITPTGRQVVVEEMMFLRLKQGQIVEVWEVTDEHAQLQQLAGSED